MQTRRPRADEGWVRPSSWTPWTPCALALVGLLAALWQLSPTAAGGGVALACAEAQLIEGQLRCDDELRRDLQAVCKAAPSRALGAGDAVELGACVCAAYPALQQIGLGCATSPVGRMAPEQLAALEQPIDLNTASAAELTSLTGIGPKLAAQIVAGRPYASVEELLAIKGIGAKRLAAIRPRARMTSTQASQRSR
jgi:hypothetical protein